MRNNPLILLGLIWVVSAILALCFSLAIEGVKVKHLALLINVFASGAFLFLLYKDEVYKK